LEASKNGFIIQKQNVLKFSCKNTVQGEVVKLFFLTAVFVSSLTATATDVKYPEFEKLEVTLNFQVDLEVPWYDQFVVEDYYLCIQNKEIKTLSECSNDVPYCYLQPMAPFATTLLEGTLVDRVVRAVGQHDTYYGTESSELELEGKLNADRTVPRWGTIHCQKSKDEPWTFSEIQDIFGDLALFSEILD
jgi:hypothetical protein